jgi:hypothetical protein
MGPCGRSTSRGRPEPSARCLCCLPACLVYLPTYRPVYRTGSAATLPSPIHIDMPDRRPDGSAGQRARLLVWIFTAFCLPITGHNICTQVREVRTTITGTQLCRMMPRWTSQRSTTMPSSLGSPRIGTDKQERLFLGYIRPEPVLANHSVFFYRNEVGLSFSTSSVK